MDPRPPGPHGQGGVIDQSVVPAVRSPTRQTGTKTIDLLPTEVPYGWPISEDGCPYRWCKLLTLVVLAGKIDYVSEWLSLPEDTDLAGATVDIAQARVAALPNRSSWLSTDELARAYRQRRPGAAEEWIGVWSWARMRLGEYFGVSPQRVPIIRDRNGRPRLMGFRDETDPFGGADFNVSHAGGLVVMAIANRPVGIDIEPKYLGVDVLSLAATVCHPKELDTLVSAEIADQPGSFTRMWTRKEALLKGIGSGFLRDPQTLLVGAGPSPAVHAEWQVVDLQDDMIGAMYGALAVRKLSSRLRPGA